MKSGEKAGISADKALMADKGLPRDAKTIAFTGGGTGGHIYPGLAVIEALRQRGFTGRIFWIGSQKPLEREIVEKQGVEFYSIPSGKLRRSFSLENFIDLFRIIAGYFAARALLAKTKPDVLFSKGGYVSVPPCRAAVSLGIPYVTHESDASPGLATRLNAGKAVRILVSWPSTAQYFDPETKKVIVCGNPVRPSLLASSPEKGRKLLGAPDGLPIVAFIGGSQGSRQINELVREALPLLEGKAFVVHQTGSAHFDPKAHAAIPGRYFAKPYFSEEMGNVLASARVAVGRSGAGMVWECASLGIPMVLIPLAGSGTRGDQVENAQLAAEAQAARVLSGDAVSGQAVASAILGYLEDEKAWKQAHNAALALSGIDREDGSRTTSADYIAETLLNMIRQS